MKEGFLMVCLILSLSAFGQYDQEQPYCQYAYADGRSSESLVLFADSTFIYKFSFKLGDTKSVGNWRVIHDTLKLFNYKLPWTIKGFEEWRIDSVKDKTIVKIILPDNDTSIIRDFPVWINDDCNAEKMTNDFGMAEFAVRTAAKVSVAYNDYYVRDTSANYIILTLSTFPIFISPHTLQFKDWKIGKKSISPIECGQVSNITLKQKVIR